jgi:hypothetical protein
MCVQECETQRNTALERAHEELSVAQHMSLSVYTSTGLHILPSFIPGALLACYGYDGVHQAVVLHCRGAPHQQGTACVHSHQGTPLAL